MHADVIIEVPFHDVDTMNVVWHGHYLKYFEIARCKLLDQFHYNYNQMRDSGYAWPVIESYVRYVQGIEFEQKIRVRAVLNEWENRLKIEYLKEGKVKQVLVSPKDQQRFCESILIKT